MEDKINKGKHILVDKLDMPKDVILDVPRIIIIGKNEVTIENHKGIIAFRDQEIKVNTSFGPLTIQGDKFEILYIASSTITISGQFVSIQYER